MDTTHENDEIQLTYLPYDLPYITEELKKRAKIELSEDESTRIHSLKLLRSMFKDEPFCNIDDETFFLAFLRTKKFNVKRAYRAIKGFFAARKKYKELFLDFNFSDVRHTLSENSIGFLPYRDEEGCCLLYIKFENWDSTESTFGHILRAVAASVMHSILSPATQVAGVKLIADFKGLTLKKFTYMSPRYLKLFVDGIQSILPVRFRAVYIVNENYFVPYLWLIVKTLLSKKMRDRFFFCGKDMANLHKYIPSKILPKEADGDLPPFDNSEWTEKMSLNLDYITHILRESKKISK